MRGSVLRLFIGNMAAGKTRHLQIEVETLRRYGKKRILVLKPTTDTRSGKGKLKSRTGVELDAVEVPARDPQRISEVVAELEKESGGKFHILAFDEIQFFSIDSGFFEVVNRLLNDGYDILGAGLALDFRGQTFGATLQIALLAQEKCVWLNSRCTKCGEPAIFPQRIIKGKPAPYDSPQIVVGGDDLYEPRCFDHFETKKE